MTAVTENDLKRLEDLIVGGQKAIESRLTAIESRLTNLENGQKAIENSLGEINLFWIYCNKIADKHCQRISNSLLFRFAALQRSLNSK